MYPRTKFPLIYLHRDHGGTTMADSSSSETNPPYRLCRQGSCTSGIVAATPSHPSTQRMSPSSVLSMHAEGLPWQTSSAPRDKALRPGVLQLCTSEGAGGVATKGTLAVWPRREMLQQQRAVAAAGTGRATVEEGDQPRRFARGRRGWTLDGYGQRKPWPEIGATRGRLGWRGADGGWSSRSSI
jgi:hypothetical protein